MLHECLTITLCFLAASVDEVDQVEEASRNRSQWTDVYRTSLLSKVSRKTVQQIMGEMMGTDCTRLLVRTLQMKFEITAKVDLDVLISRDGNIKCAMRKCARVAGRFVPALAGRGIYAADDACDGPLFTQGETAACPQMEIAEWIARYRETKYVIVCSIPVGAMRRHWLISGLGETGGSL